MRALDGQNKKKIRVNVVRNLPKCLDTRLIYGLCCRRGDDAENGFHGRDRGSNVLSDLVLHKIKMNGPPLRFGGIRLLNAFSIDC